MTRMSHRKMGLYYKLMSCVTLIIMLATLVGLVITVVGQISDKLAAWEIIKTFLNILAVLTLGSAFANLFFSYGMKLSGDCDECMIDD